MILGTGWNEIVNQIEIVRRRPYQRLFKLQSTVPGHQGELIEAKLNGRRLLIMNGRFHVYEGHSAQTTARPIQWLKDQGVTDIIITNAVGGLNPKYKVGDFVILSDMITLWAPTPLVGAKFQDLSAAFNPRLRRLAATQAKKLNLRHHLGVYCYCHGPQFETPADKRAMIALGADVVGMSNVQETIMANYLGIKVLGLAFVTNLAFVKHSHQEVLAQAGRGKTNMVKLLTEIINSI